jgi:hypothetical protein
MGLIGQIGILQPLPMTTGHDDTKRLFNSNRNFALTSSGSAPD